MAIQSGATALVRRVLTAVVAVVAFEVVGIGALLVVVRPGVLATLLSSESSDLAKGAAVLGSPLLLLLAMALAGIALAYAARSDIASGGDATSESTTSVDETSPGDDSGFSFDGGE
jgi:hypothetical protein